MADIRQDRRGVFLARLAEDLIGPAAGPDEVIEERPSDRYLTGILYPQRTELGPEQDENLASGASGDGDEGEAEQVAVMRMTRPASAGLSFAVSGAKPHLRFTVVCAQYVEATEDHIARETNQTSNHGGVDAGLPSEELSSGDDSLSKSSKPRRWRRVGRFAVLELDPRQSGLSNIELDGISGLELSIQCSPYEGQWLVTAVLVNRNSVGKGESRLAADAKAFFQVEMTVEPVKGASLPARPSRRAALDADGRSSALLYRDAMEFAVGHTCSATWVVGLDRLSASQVSTTWLPSAKVEATSSLGGPRFTELLKTAKGTCFEAEVLADKNADLPTLLEYIPSAYEGWIEEQEARIPSLPLAMQDQAKIHVRECRTCLDRMRAGIGLITSDADVAAAFRLANQAMAIQYKWTRGSHSSLRWRPFQLGFLLLAIESLARRDHSDRGVMDLLWFPTGGGKTEAYLALVAFSLFVRRLRHRHDPDRGAGTAAIMRYTLRLLTTQQFQRAAAVILACEYLRRSDQELRARLGVIPFSIGLWVGRDAVANKVSEALQALIEDKPNRPDQLTHCPACKGMLRWGAGSNAAYVKVECTGAGCLLRQEELPVWTVDEDVYKRQPTLVIGTIDKFAQLTRKAEAGTLFGLNVGYDAPDLIIQDELHLISGPLGTLAGLYEAAIDELCTRGHVRPKIVGSTATIRRASEQILAIFGRTAQLFPPPGLDASDSCFAVRDFAAPSRRYAAVTTAGRSAKFTLQAVSASLLQSAAAIMKDDSSADAYWTLVEYFNALRELGGAFVLMQDDVPASVDQFAKRRDEIPRDPELVAELTSRLSQSELRDRLRELDLTASSGAAIDVLLATNMISVGIDISRLGLMIMNGQPKAVAEYIQATSRVGRGEIPGLIVSIYNNGKARDRSRFETFRTWHETLYREVEATSVTPFSSRARDRGLHAALVIIARHLVPSLRTNPTIQGSEDAVIALAETIISRASKVEPEEAEATREQIEALIDLWGERGVLQSYHNDWRPLTSLLISSERAATMRAARREIGDAWPTPSSMRNVEPMTKVSLVERLSVEIDSGAAENMA